MANAHLYRAVIGRLESGHTCFSTYGATACFQGESERKRIGHQKHGGLGEGDGGRGEDHIDGSTVMHPCVWQIKEEGKRSMNTLAISGVYLK